MIEPSGEQYELVRGGARLVIAQLAAALKHYSIDGIDLVQPWPERSISPQGAGIVLVPWPGRIKDATWTLDGTPMQLDFSDPGKGHAIHGLLRNTGYRVLEQAADSVTLGATIFPQHGYPFHLETWVKYALRDDALEVTHGVTNLSESKAPVALGTHPYFVIGDVPTEELVLTVNATTRFETDDRGIASHEVPVDGTGFDLRGGVRVGDLDLDTTYGGVVAGTSATLTAPDGRAVHVVQDANHPYVQVFTPRNFPGPDGPGLAIALEPMTAAPDSLNNGLGLRWLTPGETWTVAWSVQYTR